MVKILLCRVCGIVKAVDAYKLYGIHLPSWNYFVSAMSFFSIRLAQCRKRSGLSCDESGQKIGITAIYVGMIALDEEEIDNDSTISNPLYSLDFEADLTPLSQVARPETTPIDTMRVARIRVISWTHASNATSHEELPSHWPEQIPVTYMDAHAFGLFVEGDSMEPRCMAGDIVVLALDEELRNGCLVVAKLGEDGVVLRRFTKLADGNIRLIPSNTLYPAIDYTARDFRWFYPIYSSVRRGLH